MVLILKFNKNKIITLILGICLIIFPIAKKKFFEMQDKVSIKVLDVGQGQSILIEYKGKKVLIDGGGTWNRQFNFGRIILSPALTYLSLPILDKVILTHPHIDHIGGLFYILKKYKIKNFYYNGLCQNRILKYLLKIAIQRKIPIHVVKKGDIILIDKLLKLEVINPPRNSYKNTNDEALILRLIYKNTPLLLIPSDVSSTTLDKISKYDIKSQILIVPHHGSKNSFSEKFIKKVHPEIAIVSSGYLNRFGVPHKKWVNFFYKNNIPLYNTATHGCIEVYWKKAKGKYIPCPQCSLTN
jgi:competence protein ComEC